jgi:hypothetical protein
MKTKKKKKKIPPVEFSFSGGSVAPIVEITTSRLVALLRFPFPRK